MNFSYLWSLGPNYSIAGNTVTGPATYQLTNASDAVVATGGLAERAVQGNYWVSGGIPLPSNYAGGMIKILFNGAVAFEDAINPHTFQPAINTNAGAVQIDMAQAVPDARTGTVGGSLNGAAAVAWGKMAIDRAAKVLKVFGVTNATTTPTASFLLDDPTNTTTRTPQ